MDINPFTLEYLPLILDFILSIKTVGTFEEQYWFSEKIHLEIKLNVNCMIRYLNSRKKSELDFIIESFRLNFITLVLQRTLN